MQDTRRAAALAAQDRRKSRESVPDTGNLTSQKEVPETGDVTSQKEEGVRPPATNNSSRLRAPTRGNNHPGSGNRGGNRGGNGRGNGRGGKPESSGSTDRSQGQ
jgi:hypothetical protein